MESLSDFEERRRRLVLGALAIGALAGCGPGAGTRSAMQVAMSSPREMPAGMSMYQLAGDVSVNGVAASLQTVLKPGDEIEAGEDSQTIFVNGKDAFLLRARSRLRLPTTPAGEYVVESGRALGVFASRRTAIRTPTAYVGIRGTGVYVESEPDRSYVCTCYGTTDLAPADAPAITETITSVQHDAPRYILADKGAASRIVPAPFKNHDDEELLLIETLVGRTTPYTVPGGPMRLRRGYP